MPTVTILRREMGSTESQEQSFEFGKDFDGSVIDLLHELNGRELLTDTDGTPARRICFECSCEDGNCGACAMLVNGKPVLACEVRVKEELRRAGKLTLAPLSVFPCVSDLQVDRSILRRREKEAGLWLTGEAKKAEDGFFSACLQCGLCAEACEKYRQKRFDAPSAYVSADLVAALDDADSVRRKAMKKALKKPFLCPCKTCDCEAVCPQRLPLRQAIKRVGGSLFSR